jgi:predicted membrane protein
MKKTKKIMKKPKSYLIFVIIAIAIIIVVVLAVLLLNLEKPQDNKKYCVENKDCACGVHVETGKCFFGNINYVNTSKQCPDFCNGIGGNLKIRCIENECKQVSVSR